MADQFVPQRAESLSRAHIDAVPGGHVGDLIAPLRVWHVRTVG